VFGFKKERSLDALIEQGDIKIEKFTKSGDGEVQFQKLSDGEYKLYNYSIEQSGGIRITNTSYERFFTFSIEIDNQAYFADTDISDFGSNSQASFTLGPSRKFEIDVDDEYNNLSQCYIEYTYSATFSDGRAGFDSSWKEFSENPNGNTFVRFVEEIPMEQLPTKANAFQVGIIGGLASFATNEIYNRMLNQYEDGRDTIRTIDYNTVKIRKHPTLPTPIIIRESLPGTVTETGFTWSDGQILEGPGTSLFAWAGDNGGDVHSISQNVPSWMYPFTKADGGRYGVMDLAEADAPWFMKMGVVEGAAGNEIERLGDIPFFRYWGDAVLMTPIVLSAVAVGVGVFFLAPVMGPPAIQAVKPLATSVVKIPMAIGRGAFDGTMSVVTAVARIPQSIKQGFND
jgi:hypothetical protein